MSAIGIAIRIFTLASLLIVPIAAKRSAAAEKLRIVFSTPPTSYMLPYLFAKDLGWFAQHGLEVEEIYVTGDANSARTLISGDSDLALVGIDTLLQMAERRAGVKAIVSWQPVGDYHLIARKGGAKNISDLKAATFAASGPNEMLRVMQQLLLQKNGIDPATVQYLHVGGHSARLQAVAAGKVDATIVNTITAKQGELAGQAQILQSVTPDFPKLGYGFVLAPTSKVSSRNLRESYALFVEGSILGARRVAREPERAVELLAKRLPNMNPEVVKSSVEELNKLNVWGVDGGLSPDVLTYTADLSVSLGTIKTQVTPDQAFDRSLVDEAIKKIGSN